jgi:LysR family nitrogen assimilation transcriptional regulator
MILKHVETFVCVYEACNITRAAARLNIVQPAVSSQLRKLETELNVKLFERSPRGITPTAAGHEMYRLFLPVLEAFRAAERRAYALGAEQPVEISVGFNPYTGSAILGGVLQAFRLRCPDVDLRMTEEISPALIERVAEGTLDLAVVNFGGEGKRYASTLVAVPLLEEDLVFVEAASDDPQPPSPILFADVAARRLVLSRSRHGFRRELEQAAAKMSLRLVAELEINAPGPLLELVASGDIATVVPEITARQAAKHLPLRIRPIMSPNVKRLIEYVHRRDRPLSAPLAILVDLVSVALHPSAS